VLQANRLSLLSQSLPQLNYLSVAKKTAMLQSGKAIFSKRHLVALGLPIDLSLNAFCLLRNKIETNGLDSLVFGGWFVSVPTAGIVPHS
jgi:hypothetical protein